MAENERLARIELRVEQLEKQMGDSTSDRFALHKLVQDIHDTIIKQKTFVGGILFTVGAMWAILQVAWDFVQKRFFH